MGVVCFARSLLFFSLASTRNNISFIRRPYRWHRDGSWITIRTNMPYNWNGGEEVQYSFPFSHQLIHCSSRMYPFSKSKSTPKAAAFLPTPPTTANPTPAAYRESKPLPPTPPYRSRPFPTEERLASPLDDPTAIGFQDIEIPSTRTPATPKIVLTHASDDSDPLSSQTLLSARPATRASENTHSIRVGASSSVAKTLAGKGVYSALLSDSRKSASPVTLRAGSTDSKGKARKESPKHTIPTNTIYTHERRESAISLRDTNHQRSAPRAPSVSRAAAIQPSHPSGPSALGLSHIKSPSLRRTVRRSLQIRGSTDLVNEEVQREKQRLSFSPPTKEERERGRTEGKIDPLNEHYVPSYDTKKGPIPALAVQLQTPKSLKRLELEPDADDRIVRAPMVPQRSRSQSRVRAEGEGGLVNAEHWAVESRDIDPEHLLQGQDGREPVGAPGNVRAPESDDPGASRRACRDVKGCVPSRKTAHVKDRTEPCRGRDSSIKAIQMSCPSGTGSWIDELTMRGLLRLVEQMLDEKQKVRVAANPRYRPLKLVAEMHPKCGGGRHVHRAAGVLATDTTVGQAARGVLLVPSGEAEAKKGDPGRVAAQVPALAPGARAWEGSQGEALDVIRS
ncbi:hypothetical protein FA13DRAFT_1810107 [Coprinellus micaceus]|uniref:Uncharacterized protein n=1 Tax=Coprinellus micaceus TaxID=71717 RepID=A0A4Y7TTW4_COPMI|nr:hypothetical protein FA13DRAFT_1810107 [Coprinellus micaceus]